MICRDCIDFIGCEAQQFTVLAYLMQNLVSCVMGRLVSLVTCGNP